MREARPYPVEAPTTSTFLGTFCPAGICPFIPDTHRSTLRRHPSGCAFTQIKPRERRLIICCGIFEVRYANAGDPPRTPGQAEAPQTGDPASPSCMILHCEYSSD